MLQHGESRELTVIKPTPEKELGSTFVKLGSKWYGWWNTSDNGYGQPKNKWKIDYGNGYVGWWDDEYFDYEGKVIK